MKKVKDRLFPEGERPIEIVLGENIERYFLQSDYSSLTAFANDLGCDSTRVKNVIEGKAVFSAQILQRAARLLNIKTIDLVEDWGEE
ncbi:XRE family transcriptional regulator [Enterococcus innesii]|nr:XRE family transcriptional regulator [Enterococcus innesii]